MSVRVEMRGRRRPEEADEQSRNWHQWDLPTQGSAKASIPAGDAGETKPRLALYERTNLHERETHKCRTISVFDSRSALSLEDIVLTYLSTGGMYLGGGNPPKIIGKLREGMTVDAYLRKGRLSPLDESTSLLVILDERAALLGAASIAAGLQ